jgi:hypothetical protein
MSTAPVTAAGVLLPSLPASESGRDTNRVAASAATDGGRTAARTSRWLGVRPNPRWYNPSLGRAACRRMHTTPRATLGASTMSQPTSSSEVPATTIRGAASLPVPSFASCSAFRHSQNGPLWRFRVPVSRSSAPYLQPIHTPLQRMSQALLVTPTHIRSSPIMATLQTPQSDEDNTHTSENRTDTASIPYSSRHRRTVASPATLATA